MTIPTPPDFPGMTLYEALQSHIRECGKCQDAIKAQPTRRLGEKTKMCPDYVNIGQVYSDWERDVNRAANMLITPEQWFEERRSQE